MNPQTAKPNPLYALRILAPGKFQLTKFDEDFNVAACYDLEVKGHSYTCNCPANNRSVVTKPCKHKRMMPYMLGAANIDRFYDPITGSWHQPLGDLGRPEAADLAGREALPQVEGEARQRVLEGNSAVASEAPEQPIEGKTSPSLQAQVGLVEQPRPAPPPSPTGIRRR